MAREIAQRPTAGTRRKRQEENGPDSEEIEPTTEVITEVITEVTEVTAATGQEIPITQATSKPSTTTPDFNRLGHGEVFMPLQAISNRLGHGEVFMSLQGGMFFELRAVPNKTYETAAGAGGAGRFDIAVQLRGKLKVSNNKACYRI